MQESEQQAMKSTIQDSEIVIKTVECRECGTIFATEVVSGFEDLHSQYCDPCGDQYEREYEHHKNEKLKHARMSRFKEICPADFVEIDRALLPVDPDRFDQVVGWQYGPRGLLIHGKTGRGKTRALWQLLKRLVVNHGYNVEVYRANAFAREIEKSFSTNQGHDSFISVCSCADVFALDDLGKFRWTERVEFDLFDIIDYRTSHNLPVIITTQYVGDTLKKRFCDPETAEAMLRRLREKCEDLRFVQPTAHENLPEYERLKK